MGLAYGIVETSDSVCGIIGNIAYGALYEYTGSYSTGLVLLQVISIVALCLIGLLLLLDRDYVASRRVRGGGTDVFNYEPIPSL